MLRRAAPALGLIVVADEPAEGHGEPRGPDFLQTQDKHPSPSSASTFPPANDPFGLRHQVALKMLLNAHSTAVMAKLGKVIGNTMTNVSPTTSSSSAGPPISSSPT